ncbi:hypothetical protein FRB94_001870 [Tulasnella sp. JGI-2019a]|nr:hypothetical protein FRB94_001870 [Tulasnella sp. JGI-2019a]KAG9017263.1 hypothetical protein FRB93_007376 [Tulasnella sp. JGI-2019a]KAG9029046.1 hypothetical protein FRB95_005780 [Tulasnella sp. JGI-2019a]
MAPPGGQLASTIVRAGVLLSEPRPDGRFDALRAKIQAGPMMGGTANGPSRRTTYEHDRPSRCVPG